eukprot:UN13445
MSTYSLDNLNPDPILGIADDAEVMEVSQLLAKLLLKGGQQSNTPKKRKETNALKLHFNSLALDTKPTDPLSLLKKRGRTNPPKTTKNKSKESGFLQFDDLLGLVTEIEKKHLLKLKEKVQHKFFDKNDNSEQIKKIIYEHFQKSRGLVMKIKNIKARKKRRRRKYAKHTKAKRYNARKQNKIIAKSRKKRLRRQALHAW